MGNFLVSVKSHKNCFFFWIWQDGAFLIVWLCAGALALSWMYRGSSVMIWICAGALVNVCYWYWDALWPTWYMEHKLSSLDEHIEKLGICILHGLDVMLHNCLCVTAGLSCTSAFGLTSLSISTMRQLSMNADWRKDGLHENTLCNMSWHWCILARIIENGVNTFWCLSRLRKFHI